MTVRILLGDDQDLVRAGFRTILEAELGFEVVGEARDGVGAVEAVGSLRPDVVCLDVEMPGMNGIEAARNPLFQAVVRHWGCG